MYSLQVHVDLTLPVWPDDVLSLVSVMQLHRETVGGIAVCARATLNAVPTPSCRGLGEVARRWSANTSSTTGFEQWGRSAPLPPTSLVHIIA